MKGQNMESLEVSRSVEPVPPMMVTTRCSSTSFKISSSFLEIGSVGKSSLRLLQKAGGTVGSL